MKKSLIFFDFLSFIIKGTEVKHRAHLKNPFLFVLFFRYRSIDFFIFFC